MQSFLRFRPLPQERVWGGRALESELGRALPPGRPFGESWEIVDRPEAQSVIAGGPLDGLTLRQAIERHGAEIMGPRWPKDKPFPILVKWLDCRERLSLQVHPPAAVAKELGGEPKTENWFVAAAAPDAHLFVGLKPGVTREQFERALADNTLEECVNRVPVSAGDSVLVRSGQVHAIGGGCLILEIQQNSDTTYRVHDWGRVGLDGKPRQLHVAESLKSILWDAAPPWLKKSIQDLSGPKWLARLTGPPEVWPGIMLANTADFRIHCIRMKKGDVITSGQLRKAPRIYPLGSKKPRILSVVEGRLTSADGEINPGENVLLPYAGKFSMTADEGTVVLLTAHFSSSGFYRRSFGLFQLLSTGRFDGASIFVEGKHFYVEDRAMVRLCGIWLLGAVVFTFALWVAEKNSLIGWFWMYVMGFAIFAKFACPFCLWITGSTIFHKGCNSRRLLAFALAALGTVLTWGAFYLRITGQLR